MLTNLPRVDGNPYVIVGRKEGCSLVNIEKAWRRIRRLAGLSTLRLHDLRHAFASVGVASGYGLPIIGKMLGHTSQATTQRYAHFAADPVKDAAASIAAKIAAPLGGSAAAPLVSLPPRRSA